VTMNKIGRAVLRWRAPQGAGVLARN
jgi:hypothetical protein